MNGADPAERLILFSRYPEPGKTKTRLISTLGPDGAAHLQRQMSEHALSRALRLVRVRPVELEVRYAGGSGELMAAWLGPGISYRPQGSGDLGVRMGRAFSDAFQSGAKKVVITGTDCPGITTTTARSAFDLLNRFDLVLGPANDGGYYLIGLRRPVPRLFQDIPWGTAEVRARTLEIAEQSGLEVVALEPFDDVDRPEDLAVWEREVRKVGEADPPSISIIIPTLDEGEHVTATLSSIPEDGEVEVLVVDGGSSDGTTEQAMAHGARLLTTSADRARQLNAGATAASGSVLLFLHADTRLPQGFKPQVLEILAGPGTAAGAFELGIAGSEVGLRFVEKLANTRSRLLQLPYGDQALFLRAELFHRLGGFPELPIMEDFVFVQRLRREGRIVTAPSAVLTSGRRWQRLGLGRTTLINQKVLLGYYLGVDIQRLARWYRQT